MAKLFIEDLDVRGKRVLVRVDFNVPLDEKQNITDDTRIRAALPTIRYIIERGGKAVLMSHLGRPKDAVDPKLRLDPVAKRLQELLPENKVTKLGDCIGPDVEKAVAAMKPGEIILLENLRFHKEEQKNDPKFAEQLARLGELYVDDAFGTAHRPDASISGVTKFIQQCAAGYLLKKEIQYLGDAVNKPQRPFIAILGGAKVSDKINVITNLLEKVDALIIGGGMAYTFLKAQGHEIGKSLLEADKIELAKQILEKARAKKVDILLPIDHVTTEKLEAGAPIKVSKNGVDPGFLAADIGPESVKIFSERIKKAKTVVWNGPMGIFEKKEFSVGTFGIAKAIAESKATSIIGGGDSVAAIQQSGLSGRMTHISTGGGASLEYLEGKELPGIAALTEKV